MLNCLFFLIFPPFVKVGTGFCPIWGIWQGAGAPATSQMRCWLLLNGRIFPAVAGILCVGLAYCTCIFLRCPHVGAAWAFPVVPRTHLAACSESRTQRRRAPHGAMQALATPAGSIGTFFSTVGRSAPSTLFRQMRRSPLLFRNETKIPFCLRVSTLFRI